MEPELMTADEWANLIGLSAWSKAQGTIRERGMIEPEPEPVDPLLDEAREIVARILEDDELTNLARHTRDGSDDDSYRVRIALTVLRRNLELAERPTLTRGMVEEAVINQRGLWSSGSKYVDCLHAALVERLK